MMRSVFVGLLLTLLVVGVAHGQLYAPQEIELLSDRIYPNPHEDMQVTCTFTGPGGSETVAGYWNGGRRYVFRFTPPRAGYWTYRTTCSDTTNAGLHHLDGGFHAVPLSGDDPFVRHGWLRVSDDHRTLVHTDGEPYFYLSDTAWEITWRSTFAELRPYFSDRKRKGFNALQIVPLSHRLLYPNGIENRNGEPFYLDTAHDVINPRYFDYLDTIVAMANDSGMAVVMAPLWAAYCYLYADNSTLGYQLNYRQCMQIARYVGARYAASNVIWIVGGDNVYDTEERRAFWGEFAHALRAASGGRHLTTVHPHGWGTSYQYFGNTTDWIDFHMYQSSHAADVVFTYDAAMRGYAMAPPLPLLNGEAIYEDMPDHFWLATDSLLSSGMARLDARDVRQAAYESVLSGAMVGMSYGAHGIWQWHNNPAAADAYYPRYTVAEAVSLPGSTQMGLLRDLLVRCRWYEMTPHPELVDASDEHRFVPVSTSDRYLLAYARHGMRYFRVDMDSLGAVARLRWMDPRTGALTAPYTAIPLLGPVTLVPPDTNDWVLVAERAGLPDIPTSGIHEVPSVHISSNPFVGQTMIRCHADIPGSIRLRVMDAAGREVASFDESASGEWAEEIGELPAGSYFYTLTFMPYGGTPNTTSGRVVSLGK